MTSTSTPGSGGGAAAPSALEPLLCFDLYASSRAMTALYRPLLGDLGLTYPQYLVLSLLHERPLLSVGQVAASLRLDHGTLTPLLRRLETAGLVSRRRSATDERVVEVALTEAGEALGPRLAEVRCVVGESVGMSEEQVKELQTTLRTLVATLEERERSDARG